MFFTVYFPPCVYLLRSLAYFFSAALRFNANIVLVLPDSREADTSSSLDYIETLFLSQYMQNQPLGAM